MVVKNYPVPVPKLISTRNMKSELDGFANQAVAIYLLISCHAYDAAYLSHILIMEWEFEKKYKNYLHIFQASIFLCGSLVIVV